MAKGSEAGKAFLEGVLSKITDPEEKAAAQRLLQSQTFATEIGNGVLGQSEIDRQLQDLRAKQQELDGQVADLTTKETKLDEWYQNLTTWGETNKELIALGRQAKEGKIPPPDLSKAPAASGLTEEKLGEIIAQERSAMLGFTTESDQLRRQHFDTFGTYLDITPLLSHPEIRSVGLKGVYGLVHKDALAAKDTEKQTAHDDKIRAEERAKILASSANVPYPIGGSIHADTSPLSALKPVNGTDGLVSEAAAEYQRLQAARGAVGTA